MHDMATKILSKLWYTIGPALSRRDLKQARHGHEDIVKALVHDRPPANILVCHPETIASVLGRVACPAINALRILLALTANIILVRVEVIRQRVLLPLAQVFVLREVIVLVVPLGVDGACLRGLVENECE